MCVEFTAKLLNHRAHQLSVGKCSKAFCPKVSTDHWSRQFLDGNLLSARKRPQFATHEVRRRRNSERKEEETVREKKKKILIFLLGRVSLLEVFCPKVSTQFLFGERNEKHQQLSGENVRKNIFLLKISSAS